MGSVPDGIYGGGAEALDGRVEGLFGGEAPEETSEAGADERIALSTATSRCEQRVAVAPLGLAYSVVGEGRAAWRDAFTVAIRVASLAQRAPRSSVAISTRSSGETPSAPICWRGGMSRGVSRGAESIPRCMQSGP